MIYVIGDLVDRGSQPIETIKFVRDHPKIRVIMGNHDEMMLHTLKYKDEVQAERWSRNRNEPSLEGFNKLSKNEQDEILNYLKELPYYEIIDNKYLLVHAGFESDRLNEDMKTMDLEEALINQKDRLVWVRDEFLKNKALDDLITIFGHSTRKYINKAFGIESKPPYEIWLDDMEIFYIE